MDLIEGIIKLEKERKENLISSLDNIIQANQLENEKFYKKLNSEYPQFFKYMNKIHKDNSFLLHFRNFELSIDNLKMLNPIYDKDAMCYDSLYKDKIKKFVSNLYDESLENIEVYFFDEKFITNFQEAFTVECGKDNHVVFLAKNHPDLDNTLAHEFGHNIFDIVSRKNDKFTYYYSHQFIHELVAFFTQLKYIEKYGDKKDCINLLHMLVQLDFAYIILNFPNINFEDFYKLDEIKRFKNFYNKNELERYYNMFKRKNYYYEYCYKFSSLILAINLIDDLESIKKLMYYDRDKSINGLLLDLDFNISNINEEIINFVKRFE